MPSCPLIVTIQSIKFKSGQLEVILNHYVQHAVSEYLKKEFTENHSVAEIEAIREATFDHNSAFVAQVHLMFYKLYYIIYYLI